MAHSSLASTMASGFRRLSLFLEAYPMRYFIFNLRTAGGITIEHCTPLLAASENLALGR